MGRTSSPRAPEDGLPRGGLEIWTDGEVVFYELVVRLGPTARWTLRVTIRAGTDPNDDDVRCALRRALGGTEGAI